MTPPRALHSLVLVLVALPALAQDAGALLTEGRTRLAKDDYDGAIASLTAALEADPSRYEAHLLRGHARNGRRDHEGALSDYLKALQGAARQGKRAEVRGALLAAKGNRRARLAALSALVLDDQTDWEAYRGRAEVRQAGGDVAGARGDYAKLVTRAGAAPADLLGLARCLEQLGKRDQAIAACDRALKAAGQQPKLEARVLSLRGDLRRLSGKVKQARADYDRAIQLAPDLGSAYLGRGMARTRDLESSIRDLTRAAELGERLAFHERGITNLLRRDLKAALADFSAHLTKHPGDVVTSLERAKLRLRLRDAAGALQDVDAALKRLSARRYRKMRSQAFLIRARIEAAAGKGQAALRDLGLAIQLNGRSQRAFVDRAKLRTRRGDLVGALGDANSALHLESRRPSVWALRADVQFLIGSPEGAVRDWGQAFKLAQGRVRPGWLIERARALRAVGQVRQALSDLDLAVGKPGRTDPWVHRGLTRLLAGDTQNAIQDLKTSLQQRKNAAASIWLGALGQKTEALQQLSAGRGWAGLLARFVSGQETPRALLAAAQETRQGRVRLMRLADAHCMIGLSLEGQGDKVGASRHYQACLATRVTDAVTWQWLSDRVRIQQLIRRARRRRRRGQGQPPPTPKQPKKPAGGAGEPY